MQQDAICKFLHGPLTSQHAVQVVKEALAAGVEKHFEILYYKKDGKYSSVGGSYGDITPVSPVVPVHTI